MQSKAPFLCLVPLLALSIAVNAQTLVNKLWQDTTGHPTSTSYFQTAKTDGSGNIYVAGSTYHQGESANVLITKYSSGGSQLWQFEFNTTSDHADIITDLYIKGNSYYITGTAWDSVNFRSRLFVARGSVTTGDTVWARTYLGAYSGYNAGASILPDNSGNIFVGGSEQQSSTNFRMLVMKYDSIGTLLWTSSYDSAGYYDAGVALAFGVSKNALILTGFSGSGFASWDFVTAPFNQSTGALSVGAVVRSSNGNGAFSKPVGIGKDYSDNTFIVGTAAVSGTNTDIKLIKYDTLFNEIWVRRWGSPDSLKEEALAFAQDNYANLLVTGYTMKANGAKDLLILKYNTSGTLLWSRTITAPNLARHCWGKDIIADDSLNVYVTGSYNNDLNSDILTACYSKDGDLKWLRNYASTDNVNDEASDIVVDSAHNVYVSGRSSLASPKYITFCYEQRDFNKGIVTDTSIGQYMRRQLIVRFNPDIVNPSFVNNKEIQFAVITQVLPDSVIDTLSLKLGFLMDRAIIGKIFNRLTIADSLSIARDGDTIVSPKFWATVMLYLPISVPDSLPKIQDTLNTLTRYAFNAGKNLLVQDFSYPDDPYYPKNSGYFAQSYNSLCDSIQGINICPVWDDGRFGDYNFRIGIFDGGVRFSHEEFVTAPLTSKAYEGYDFVTGQANPITDATDHGTGVAAIAAGLTNNGLGAAGVAGGDLNGVSGSIGCALINMKSDFTLAKRCEALVMGATHSPDSTRPGYEVYIANMSWGADGASLSQADVRALQDAVRWLYRNGVVCVAASGNAPGYVTNYPASLTTENMIIKVAGSDTLGGGNGNFSSGPNVDVIAPSVETQLVVASSAGDDAYYNLSMAGTNGTSYSAPLVSGLAGVLQSYYYYITESGGTGVVLYPDDIENLLEIYAKNNAPAFGHGLINAGNTYDHIKYPAYKIRHRVSAPASSSSVAKVDSNMSIKLNDSYERASETVGSPHVLLPAGTYTADVYKVGGTTVPFSLPPNETIINYWKNNSKTTLWREPQGVQHTVVPEADFNIISVNNANGIFEGYTYHITSGPNGAMNQWVPVNVSGANFGNGKVYYTLHTYDATLDAISEITKPGTNLSVFPNPASSKLFVSTKNEESSGGEMSIFDISGRTVWTLKYEHMSTSHPLIINLESFQQGIYIVSVRCQKYTEQVKFIITR